MKQLFSQLKWQLLILNKNYLIAISIVVTIGYAFLLLAIKELDNTEKFLTLLIYNDPAIIGLFFVGVSIILEKNQGVLSALFVAPINHHSYLIAKVLALSLIGWACALAMAFAAFGTAFHWFHFSVGAFSTCLIFSLFGVLLVCYTDEFLLFMLKSIPVLFILSAPLFNYFNLTDIEAFYFTPIQGCLNLILNSYVELPNTADLIYGYASIIFWVPLLYFLIFRIFKNKVINQ